MGALGAYIETVFQLAVQTEVETKSCTEATDNKESCIVTSLCKL